MTHAVGTEPDRRYKILSFGGNRDFFLRKMGSAFKFSWLILAIAFCFSTAVRLLFPDKTSDAGRQLIKGFEGLKLVAYKCEAGIWTIGWGHTGKVDGRPIVAGMTITKEKAEDLFNEDVINCENGVKSLIKVPLNDNEFGALVSFVFNLGSKNLRKASERRFHGLQPLDHLIFVVT